MRKKVSRKALLNHFSICLNKAIVESCPKDPTTIFRGCPETTQLAWRAMDALGFGLEAVVIQGKGLTWKDPHWVDHIWVELPEQQIKVETNAWQILGQPRFAAVIDIEDFASRYRGGFENMELLDRLTPDGQKFYGRLAEGIAKCVRARA